MDTSIFVALEEEDLITYCCCITPEEKTPTNQKKMGARNLEKIRDRYGEYHWLVQELRLDGIRFQNYFRVSPTEFEFLANVLCLLGYHINNLYI